jgi:hypothetical protein
MEELEFHEHPHFSKSLGVFIKKHKEAVDGFAAFKRLAHRQFNPNSPQAVIGPGKIHRIHQNTTYTVWKVEMSVRGLRKNQSPRVWFAVRGSLLVFLCIGTHVENYDDASLTQQAMDSVTEYF